ncbi:O-antigen ligase family protein [Mariprofundus erugo]|uniref:O-antigen ligase family protein n=1 Tax=Mariprofundus erugo TaxID=2528639 RepID=A0A5R9GLP0_9PROT|nr:O-antigen ligase family protein [Mariprofundus erugo]TLS67346.1 O-antigen ligase family protein [Mariprofundus erugo]
MIQSPPLPYSAIAFIALLATPLAYPGFFPHDVNILSASAATLLFVIAIAFENRGAILLPTKFLTALGLLVSIQLWLYGSQQLLSVSTWLLQLLLYSMAGLMFVAGASVPVKSLQRWLQLYLLAAILWSAIGLFVWLGGTDGEALRVGPFTITMPPAIKLAGPFNQGNVFAGLTGLALLFSHWFAWKKKHWKYVVAATFFTAMLFDTLSRGGWLAFSLSIAALLFAIKPDKQTWLRCFLLPWLCGITMGVLLSHYSQPALAHEQSMISVINTAGTSLTARLTIWATALAEFLQAPFTGNGWGQYAARSWLVAPQAASLLASAGQPHQLANVYFSAHNLFLHIMAEGGIIALLATLTALWSLMACSIRLLKKAHNIRICYALAAIAFIIQSQINIIYTKPVPLLLFAFFAGVAMAPRLRRYNRKHHLHRIILILLPIMTALYLIWSTPVIMQWFRAEKALYAFDFNDEASVKTLASFTDTARIGAIPAIWITYQVAVTGQHRGLLKWSIPPLTQVTRDLPLIPSYQLLFYALAGTGSLQQACKIGEIISNQHFSLDHNNKAYQESCTGKVPAEYNFSQTKP